MNGVAINGDASAGGVERGAGARVVADLEIDMADIWPIGGPREK